MKNTIILICSLFILCSCSKSEKDPIEKIIKREYNLTSNKLLAVTDSLRIKTFAEIEEGMVEVNDRTKCYNSDKNIIKLVLNESNDIIYKEIYVEDCVRFLNVYK